MKAAQITKYSKDLNVTVKEIATPKPQANEVLIKVSYAAVNPLDLMNIHGSVKLIQDYSIPLTLGNEVVGEITAIGSNVTPFKPSDLVYTRLPLAKIGGFAEYVVVDANAIWYTPTNLSAKEAVAVPLTGLTAYQGLTEELAVEAGKTIFIPGGSGSFGQLAVPVAKSLGLTVIVSGNAEAREHILELGADQYLDYRTTDYWQVLNDVDYVIDTRGAQDIERELSIMKPGGRLLSLVAGPNKHFAITNQLPAWKRLLFSLVGNKWDKLASKAQVDYRFIFVRSDGQQLKKVTELVEKHHITPAIDPHDFDLDHVQDALELVANGKLAGKVVIRLTD